MSCCPVARSAAAVDPELAVEARRGLVEARHAEGRAVVERLAALGALRADGDLTALDLERAADQLWA